VGKKGMSRSAAAERMRSALTIPGVCRMRVGECACERQPGESTRRGLGPEEAAIPADTVVAQGVADRSVAGREEVQRQQQSHLGDRRESREEA